ncbi:hypothetical protein [Paenarthrobacter nicotinovorans]|uniref:hypothetical protein n=1 Tax=Paenarthrobacter nicotinovorans TaxID=29320 RepID=UPI0039A5505C
MSSLEIHGQADRFNVRPLEDICFTVVCRGTSSFQSQLLRIEQYRNESDTPFMEAMPVTSSIDTITERGVHAMCLRPFLEVPGSEGALAGAPGVTLGALIRPDETKESFQGVVTAWDSTSNSGIGLFLQNQRLTLLVGDGHATFELSLPEALHPGRWYEVAVSYDVASGLGTIFMRPSTSSAHEERRGSQTTTGHRRLEQLPTVPIVLGTSAKYVAGWTAAEESFKGTIESPYVIAKSTPASDLWGLHARRLNAPDLVAAWDFSEGLSADGLHADQIPDIVGSFHAHCVNAPMRAVPGHLGSQAGDIGTTPQSYGAIRLIERRPDPERWKSRIVLPVPRTLQTGFYAVRLKASIVEEFVPFVVSRRAETGDPLPQTQPVSY